MAVERLADARTGKNGRHALVGMLRQSVFGRWLAVEKNLFALADLSGQWIDKVHGRRPPKGVVLDMDSSVVCDLEGAPAAVLRGGQNVLRSSEVVQLEVVLMNYNAGAPEAIDVFHFMANRGFVVYDICGFVRPNPSCLVQVDVLFVPKDSSLRRHFFTFN